MEEIFIPATGMTMEEAELVLWLKQPGDVIAPGDAIATIETDKVTVDIAAETGGVLDEHLVEAGTLVGVGAVITRVLSDPAERAVPAPAAPAVGPPEPAAPAVAAGHPIPAEDPAPTELLSPAPVPSASVAKLTSRPALDQPATAGGRRPHALTPRRRREARERAAAEPIAPPREPLTDDSPIAIPAAPSIKADSVAKAVTQSWATIPHFAAAREIDVTGMLAYLADLKSEGADVSVTDLLLRAAARSWAITRPAAPDTVGLLVATPRRALNVTVGGAASADLRTIASMRSAVVERARRGMLKPGDLAASEVSVSNLGTHGVDWFTGIIPVGQVGLFTIGRARESLQLVRGEVVSRQTIWVTINLDHREFDGADAAELLAAFASACSITLNDPTRPEAT